MRLAVLMVAVMGGTSALGQETPPAVPTFPSAVELITVDAVVLDRDGRPVPGLDRDDFVVSEDGLAPARAQTVRTALARFLSEGVRDGDELIFATTSGSGDVVRRASPSLIEPSPDGRLLRLLGVPLDGLTEGDYELRLFRGPHFLTVRFSQTSTQASWSAAKFPTTRSTSPSPS